MFYIGFFIISSDSESESESNTLFFIAFWICIFYSFGLICYLYSSSLSLITGYIFSSSYSESYYNIFFFFGAHLFHIISYGISYDIYYLVSPLVSSLVSSLVSYIVSSLVSSIVCYICYICYFFNKICYFFYYFLISYSILEPINKSIIVYLFFNNPSQIFILSIMYLSIYSFIPFILAPALLKLVIYIL